MISRRAAAACLPAIVCAAGIACAAQVRPSDPMGYVPETAVAAGRADIRRIGGDTSYGNVVPPAVGQALTELSIPMSSV